MDPSCHGRGENGSLVAATCRGGAATQEAPGRIVRRGRAQLAEELTWQCRGGAGQRRWRRGAPSGSLRRDALEKGEREERRRENLL